MNTEAFINENYIRLTRALAIIMSKYPMGIPYDEDAHSYMGQIPFGDEVLNFMVDTRKRDIPVMQLGYDCITNLVRIAFSFKSERIAVFVLTGLDKDCWDYAWGINGGIRPYSERELENEVHEFVCDYFIDGDEFGGWIKE